MAATLDSQHWGCRMSWTQAPSTAAAADRVKLQREAGGLPNAQPIAGASTTLAEAAVPGVRAAAAAAAAASDAAVKLLCCNNLQSRRVPCMERGLQSLCTSGWQQARRTPTVMPENCRDDPERHSAWLMQAML